MEFFFLSLLDTLIWFIYFDVKVMFINSSIFHIQERYSPKVRLGKLTCLNRVMVLKEPLLPWIFGIGLLSFPPLVLALAFEVKPLGTDSP